MSNSTTLDMTEREIDALIDCVGPTGGRVWEIHLRSEHGSLSAEAFEDKWRVTICDYSESITIIRSRLPAALKALRKEAHAAARRYREEGGAA